MDDQTNTGTNFGNPNKLHKNKQKSESKLLTIPRDNSPNRSYNSGSEIGEEEDKSNLSRDEAEQDSNHVVLPFEVLIEQHHSDLFFRFWDIFHNRVKYQEFVRILSLILGDAKAKEWLTDFLERWTTRNYFDHLHVKD